MKKFSEYTEKRNQTRDRQDTRASIYKQAHNRKLAESKAIEEISAQKNASEMALNIAKTELINKEEELKKLNTEANDLRSWQASLKSRIESLTEDLQQRKSDLDNANNKLEQVDLHFDLRYITSFSRAVTELAAIETMSAICTQSGWAKNISEYDRQSFIDTEGFNCVNPIKSNGKNLWAAFHKDLICNEGDTSGQGLSSWLNSSVHITDDGLQLLRQGMCSTFENNFQSIGEEIKTSTSDNVKQFYDHVVTHDECVVLSKFKESGYPYAKCLEVEPEPFCKEYADQPDTMQVRTMFYEIFSADCENAQQQPHAEL